MPSRKRKLGKAQQEVEPAAIEAVVDSIEVAVPKQNAVAAVVGQAQSNEAFHTKYIKELQQIYKKLGHATFEGLYRTTLEIFLACDESQHFANIALTFMAKFIASFGGDETHPMLKAAFDYLLNTVSLVPSVRFRICQFVNLLLNALGNEAGLDDAICDNILKYMFVRAKDASPNVRVQALNAMQRLQSPDDTNDKIVRIYLHHLSFDPSVVVRQTVITAIGRNLHTVPYILERLWDADERVRRHVYLQMSSYPVKSYKVVQRLTILEQGLHERSDAARKVVSKVLLPQWLEAYNNNYIDFVSGLKVDANEEELERFRKTAKLALLEVFNAKNVNDLIRVLPLDEREGAIKCIPIEKVSVDNSLYWLSLVEYLKLDDERAQDLELIVPELSSFCAYITDYCKSINTKAMDKWQRLEHQYVLLTLIEMLITYDLSDEYGRNNLKQFLSEILLTQELDEPTVNRIIKCIEILIPEQNERLQFIVDIVRNIVDLNTSVVDLSNPDVVNLLNSNQDLKVRVTSIKLKIMELEEQETNCVQQKDYVRAEELKKMLSEHNDQLSSLIEPLINSFETSTATNISILHPRRVSSEGIIKCLQMVSFVASSKQVRSLNPSMCNLFKDFIRRQIESNQTIVIDWALKCSITFSMLYDQLAEEVYTELYAQIFKHQASRLWNTSIRGMFELIERYGFERFEINDGTTESNGGDSDVDKPKSKKKTTTRQLYNAVRNLDTFEESTVPKQTAADVMSLLKNIYNDCKHPEICASIIEGYCRLVLSGNDVSTDITSNLILVYFNPATETQIQQTLGIFFETLIKRRQQECLQPALLHALWAVIEAPTTSPLLEVNPETILIFVINSTLPAACSPGLNIHNTIALSFLSTMMDNLANRDLLRLLTKSMLMLEISDDPVLRKDLIASVDRLLENSLEPKTERNINSFKQILEGNRVEEQLTFTSTARPSAIGEQSTEITVIAALNESVADKSLADEANHNTNAVDAVFNEEATVNNVEPTVNNVEPTVNNVEQTDKNEEPTVNNEAPTVTNDTSILLTSSIAEADVTANTSTSSTQSPPAKRPTSKRSPSKRSNDASPPNKNPSRKAATSERPPLTLRTPNTRRAHKTINNSPTTANSSTANTPTTYGLENSTQTRNLRKSLHAPALSGSAEAVSRLSGPQPTQIPLRNVRTNRRSSRRAAVTPQTEPADEDEEDDNDDTVPESSEGENEENEESAVLSDENVIPATPPSTSSNTELRSRLRHVLANGKKTPARPTFSISTKRKRKNVSVPISPAEEGPNTHRPPRKTQKTNDDLSESLPSPSKRRDKQRKGTATGTANSKLPSPNAARSLLNSFLSLNSTSVAISKSSNQQHVEVSRERPKRGRPLKTTATLTVQPGKVKNTPIKPKTSERTNGKFQEVAASPVVTNKSSTTIADKTPTTRASRSRAADVASSGSAKENDATGGSSASSTSSPLRPTTRTRKIGVESSSLRLRTTPTRRSNDNRILSPQSTGNQTLSLSPKRTPQKPSTPTKSITPQRTRVTAIRIALPTSQPRTRRAIAEEIVNNNIITRKRLSADNALSPIRNMVKTTLNNNRSRIATRNGAIPVAVKVIIAKESSSSDAVVPSDTGIAATKRRVMPQRTRIPIMRKK